MLVTILAFLFILAFSITIHEFGHFLIAKLFKIPVEKFSIGYGPPLIRKKIGETDFRIAYFPLGGYVKIAGEDEGEFAQKALNKEIPEDTESTEGTEQKNTEYTEKNGTEGTEKEPRVAGFYDAPIYKRVLIVLAGPVFNIISAFFVYVAIFSIYGVMDLPYSRVIVEEESIAKQCGMRTNDSIVAAAGQSVSDWNKFLTLLTQHQGDTINLSLIRGGVSHEINLPANVDSLGIQPLVPPMLGSLKLDGPAHKAGMKRGNRVQKINGEEIESWNQMVDRVRESKGEPLDIVWVDEGMVKKNIVSPELFYDASSKDSIWQIGAIMPLLRRHISIGATISLSITEGIAKLRETLQILYQLIVGRISRRAIGGPIAIFRLSGESARWGFEYLLSLLAIISINLGLINLFPIPALDGGHVVISIIEAVRRKRFSHRTRLIIQQVGYAIILLLIVFVTFNDITR